MGYYYVKPLRKKKLPDNKLINKGIYKEVMTSILFELNLNRFRE